jgi:hypothetical protein
MLNPKSSLVSLLVLAGLLTLSAEDAPKPVAPQESTVMVADLRAELPGLFSYSTWEDRITATKSGIAVLGGKGALGNGGLGREISPVMDFTEVEFVEVALGTLPGNELPQATIALNDADGTQFTARVPIDYLVPGQPVWLRARRADFRLNGVEPGADSKMDWSQVKRWHLQGDWTTRSPASVIFVALRVRR